MLCPETDQHLNDAWLVDIILSISVWIKCSHIMVGWSYLSDWASLGVTESFILLPSSSKQTVTRSLSSSERCNVIIIKGE